MVKSFVPCRPRVALIVLAPAIAVLAPVLSPYSIGALPGENGSLGLVPINVTRAMPACGYCHRVLPGGNAIDVDVALSARSLTPGQSISVTTSASGGTAHILNWGGFCCDADVGTFSAGAGTRIAGTGLAITHTLPSASPNRSWTYGYTAPMTPGPVNVFAVVNTVDGDNLPTANDLWAFHGGDGAERTPTPVRMYVNAPNVTPVGDACVGSWGNYPVLGAPQPPTRGNANFVLEVVGAAPSSGLVMLIGTAMPPVDLTPVGIAGCTLLVNSVATVIVGTTGGNPKFAEGTALVPLPIPGSARGRLRVQAAFVDLLNARSLPLTLTNALDIAIQ